MKLDVDSFNKHGYKKIDCPVCHRYRSQKLTFSYECFGCARGYLFGSNAGKEQNVLHRLPETETIKEIRKFSQVQRYDNNNRESCCDLYKMWQEYQSDLYVIKTLAERARNNI